MVEMSSMDWRRFVRALHQVPAEANTLRRRADDEPVDPATVQGMRTEPDTVMGESGPPRRRPQTSGKN